MNHYDVIVIGGGVMGLSTAMQLGKRGLKVIVIEKSLLGSGSTGSAAGLLGQLRSSKVASQMLMDGVQIVQQLEEVIGQQIFYQTGSLRVATSEQRAKEIHAHVNLGKSIQFAVELIDQKQAQQLLPYMKVDDLVAISYCATDGHIQPAELAKAYKQVGAQYGVEYRTQEKILGLLIEQGQIAGVKSSRDTYHAPIVVNCAGIWAYQVARLAGNVLPTVGFGHYYIVTMPEQQITIDPMSPAVRDKDHLIYSRPEMGGLLVGLFEPNPDKHDLEYLGDEFQMSAMKCQRDNIKVATTIYYAHQRFPFINERFPLTATTGIIGYTPDDEPLLGELPEIKGLYHCAGFSHGIVQSPSIGVAMAELIVDGRSRYDLATMRADRFCQRSEYQNWDYIVDRCYQTCGSYYAKIQQAQ